MSSHLLLGSYILWDEIRCKQSIRIRIQMHACRYLILTFPANSLILLSFSYLSAHTRLLNYLMKTQSFCRLNGHNFFYFRCVWNNEWSLLSSANGFFLFSTKEEEKHLSWHASMPHSQSTTPFPTLSYNSNAARTKQSFSAYCDDDRCKNKMVANSHEIAEKQMKKIRSAAALNQKYPTQNMFACTCVHIYLQFCRYRHP